MADFLDTDGYSFAIKKNIDEDYQNLILSQYQNSKNLLAICTAIAKQLQDIEDFFKDIATKRFLTVATDATLDEKAADFGIKRGGRTDDELRLTIFINVLIKNTSCTTENILNILRLIFNPGNLYITDIAAGYFKVFLTELYIQDLTQVCKILDKIKPAGLKYELTASIKNSNFFKFAAFGYQEADAIYSDDPENLKIINNNNDNLIFGLNTQIDKTGSQLGSFHYKYFARKINEDGDFLNVNQDDYLLLSDNLKDNNYILGGTPFAIWWSNKNGY